MFQNFMFMYFYIKKFTAISKKPVFNKDLSEMYLKIKVLVFILLHERPVFNKDQFLGTRYSTLIFQQFYYFLLALCFKHSNVALYYFQEYKNKKKLDFSIHQATYTHTERI